MNRLHPDTEAEAGPRRWSVGVVLVVALALALVVPLVNRAFGEGDRPNSYPGCGLAPWTGTCTCMLTPSGNAIGFEAFDRAVRDPNVRPRVKDPEAVLAVARRECRLPAAQAR